MGTDHGFRSRRTIASVASPIDRRFVSADFCRGYADSIQPRLLISRRASPLELTPFDDIRKEFTGVQQLYFGGDMEAAVPLTGPVCGRIDAVLPVRQIIEETIRDFHARVLALAAGYGGK